MIFTVIAFWTGAGGWIIIMYGALNTISSEVMEAARIDGAGPLKTAWYIQIPLLRKWIAYMGVISIAAGSQLFVEPKILSLGEQGRRPEGLFAQSARVRLRLRPPSGLQRLGGDFDPPAGRRDGPCSILRLQRRTL